MGPAARHGRAAKLEKIPAKKPIPVVLAGFPAPPPKPEDLARLAAALREEDIIGAMFESRRLPTPWREIYCALPPGDWQGQPLAGLYVLGAYCNHRIFRADATPAEVVAWREVHDACMDLALGRKGRHGPRPKRLLPAARRRLRDVYDDVRGALEALQHPTDKAVRRIVSGACDGWQPEPYRTTELLAGLKGDTSKGNWPAPLWGALADWAGMSLDEFRRQVAHSKVPAGLP